MPACAECIQPCNCRLAEDGQYANRPDLGRNFTTIDGSGTSEDPYVIHYMHQLEFRPKTLEMQIVNQQVPTSPNSWDFFDLTSVDDISFLYQEPVTFVVSPFLNLPHVAVNYYYIGVSVTFAQTADASTNVRGLLLAGTRGNAFPFEEYIVASQNSPGGGSDPLTLTASAFVPGIFAKIDSLDTVIQPFSVHIRQNSGSPIALTDFRIWITQI